MRQNSQLLQLYIIVTTIVQEKLANDKEKEFYMLNDCLLVDEKKQSDILYYMPSQEVLELLANYFQGFSDPTRIKILSALAMSELCVNDISALLDINQTTVSHQLKLLKNLNVVKFKRDGKVIFYSLANPTINDIMLTGVNQVLKA